MDMTEPPTEPPTDPVKDTNPTFRQSGCESTFENRYSIDKIAEPIMEKLNRSFDEINEVMNEDSPHKS
jgi:hypothetical protein